MAQVVIFAPTGEDVSAGEQALKDAGHEVEVVEATPANLLHMAIGMVEGTAEEPAEDQPITEPVEEEPPAEEEPAEAEEEPTAEAITDRVVSIDGERVPAYIDRTRSFPLLRVVDLSGDAKISYKLNESEFSFWRDAGATPFIKVEGCSGKMVKTKVARAKKKSHVVLDEATAKLLGLV
jgi:hypothetical protein